ncbi:MAG: peptidase S41, partial [Burkholderiales bacterium]|nr:peptidase S41 [Burkholderiales bacterium]
MMYMTRYALILLLGIFIGAGVTLDSGVLAERDTAKAIPSALPLDELRTFTEVFSKIKSDYVE